MYVLAPGVEFATPTVFMARPRASENCNVERKNVKRDLVSHNSYLNYLPVWPMKILPAASENVNPRPGIIL